MRGTSCLIARTVALALVTGAVCVTPAFAQEPQQRSYRALFGGASVGAERDATALSLAVSEAYDDNVAADLGGPTTSAAFQESGFFTEFTGDFTFHAGSENLGFATTAGTDLRYYPGIDEVVGIGHYVGAGVAATLARATTLTANQTVSYAPSYLYRLFAPAAPPELGQAIVARDYAATDQRSWNYGTTVGLAHEIGARNELSFRAASNYTNYLGEDPRLRDFWNYDLGGSFSHNITQHAALRTGYTFRHMELIGGATPTEHTIDVGVDYDRPVSRSRRATLSFAIGSTLLNGPVPGEATSILRRQYRITGDVSYGRQFARTWEARAAYHRGIGYIEGIRSLVGTDAVTLTAMGMASDSIDLTLMAAYSRGEPTAPAFSQDGFETYTGSTRIRVALTPTLAAYTEYLYYYYDFPRYMIAIPDLPSRMSRNGVRVGLMLWVPIARVR